MAGLKVANLWLPNGTHGNVTEFAYWQPGEKCENVKSLFEG